MGIAGAIWLLVTGIRPADPPPEGGWHRRLVERASGLEGRRIALSAAMGALAVLLVRWPVAVVAAGAAGWFIPLPGDKAARQRAEARTEAIAQWCEMLRDTAGTARGIEGMLIATAASAPAPIRPELRRMAHRLENEPLEAVLDGLGEDLAHPVGDMVVVALRLAATAGSRRVRSVLTQLAATANASAAMRRRVEVARARPRSATRLVALVVAAFVVGLLVFSRDYVEPYGTPLGQLVLVGIGGYWALGFWWLVRLGRLPEPARFITPRRSTAPGGAQ